MISAGTAINRPNQCQAVKDAGLEREVFANPDTRYFGCNGIERATHFAGSIGFGVPRVDVARSAGQPNKDHCLAVSAVSGSMSTIAKKVRQ
jgi:hypothetical protein